MCVFHRFPVSRAFLDNFWHYPESTLVPVCIQISKYDYFRNPDGTCAKTDWTLWHEKFRVPLEPERNRESTRSDHQQIAKIRQCGTRFWVHDQEQVWLSCAMRLQTTRTIYQCKKHAKRIAAVARRMSSRWESDPNQTMLNLMNKAKDGTTEALLSWKPWNLQHLTLHGLCGALAVW